MSRRRVNFYKTVPANDYKQDSFIPDNGDKWYIDLVYGHGVHNNEVKIDICFGESVCVMSVHGDCSPYDPETTITGDGATALVLKLTNDSSSSETYGGGYRAVKL